MQTLENIDAWLSRILLALSGVSILALMLLATGNVVLRVFAMPYRGAYEMVSFFGAIGVAFALAATQRRKMHIIVDIVSSHYSQSLRRGVNFLSSLLSAAFFVIVAWQVARWGTRIMVSGEVSETLKIIYHPFIFAVAAGFALLALTCLLDIPRGFKREKGATR